MSAAPLLDVTEELASAAWSTLTIAWALQWALIVAAGSSVPGLQRLGVLGDTLRVRTIRRVGATLAMSLCVSSAPLVYDTYQVEDNAETALRTVQCSAKSGPIFVDCDDGRWHLQVVGLERRDAKVLWVLPASGLVVARAR